MTFALCLVWHMCDKFNGCCWNFDYNARWTGAAAWWTAKNSMTKPRQSKQFHSHSYNGTFPHTSHIWIWGEYGFFPPPTAPCLPAKLFVVCRCSSCGCCAHTRLTFLRLSSHRSFSCRTYRTNLFGSLDMCRFSIFLKASQCTFMSTMCSMHTY